MSSDSDVGADYRLLDNKKRKRLESGNSDSDGTPEPKRKFVSLRSEPVLKLCKVNVSKYLLNQGDIKIKKETNFNSEDDVMLQRSKNYADQATKLQDLKKCESNNDNKKSLIKKSFHQKSSNCSDMRSDAENTESSKIFLIKKESFERSTANWSDDDSDKIIFKEEEEHGKNVANNRNEDEETSDNSLGSKKSSDLASDEDDNNRSLTWIKQQQSISSDDALMQAKQKKRRATNPQYCDSYESDDNVDNSKSSKLREKNEISDHEGSSDSSVKELKPRKHLRSKKVQQKRINKSDDDDDDDENNIDSQLSKDIHEEDSESDNDTKSSNLKKEKQDESSSESDMDNKLLKSKKKQQTEKSCRRSSGKDIKNLNSKKNVQTLKVHSKSEFHIDSVSLDTSSLESTSESEDVKVKEKDKLKKKVKKHQEKRKCKTTKDQKSKKRVQSVKSKLESDTDSEGGKKTVKAKNLKPAKTVSQNIDSNEEGSFKSKYAESGKTVEKQKVRESGDKRVSSDDDSDYNKRLCHNNGRNSSDLEHKKTVSTNKKSLIKQSSSSSSSASDTSSLDSMSDNENVKFKAKETDKKKTVKKSKEKRKPTERDPESKVNKPKTSTSQDSTYLLQLKKIVRACGIHLKYVQIFADHNSEKAKVNKLKEILEEAGMKGQPSMKKVEKIKLKKEAAELDIGNILPDSGRSKRQAASLYSRRGRSPSPELEVTPVKQKFSRLKDIIDSEGSSSE